MERGLLNLIRNSDGKLVGAELDGISIKGFRSAEQRLVPNTQSGTFLAVTLALECDAVTFTELPPEPEESEEPAPEPEPEPES